jgi:CubicO group peptidase (beta-lactamase class C family)
MPSHRLRWSRPTALVCIVGACLIADTPAAADDSAAQVACEARIAQAWKSASPVSGLGSASSLDSDAHVVGRLMTEFQVPGGAVAVAKDGRLVLTMAIGLAETELPQPVSPDRLFRIASVSKQITAATILRLVEAGKLSLTDKPFQILSPLQPIIGRTRNPQLAAITVADLLHHTGGWNRDTEGSGLPAGNASRASPQGRNRRSRVTAAIPPKSWSLVKSDLPRRSA